MPAGALPLALPLLAAPLALAPRALVLHRSRHGAVKEAGAQPAVPPLPLLALRRLPPLLPPPLPAVGCGCRRRSFGGLGLTLGTLLRFPLLPRLLCCCTLRLCCSCCRRRRRILGRLLLAPRGALGGPAGGRVQALLNKAASLFCTLVLPRGRPSLDLSSGSYRTLSRARRRVCRRAALAKARSSQPTPTRTAHVAPQPRPTCCGAAASPCGAASLCRASPSSPSSPACAACGACRREHRGQIQGSAAGCTAPSLGSLVRSPQWRRTPYPLSSFARPLSLPCPTGPA